MEISRVCNKTSMKRTAFSQVLSSSLDKKLNNKKTKRLLHLISIIHMTRVLECSPEICVSRIPQQTFKKRVNMYLLFNIYPSEIVVKRKSNLNLNKIIIVLKRR